MINEKYGISIQATRVYDYPNIRKMADYLITELPEKREIVDQIIPSEPNFNLITLASIREEIQKSLAETLGLEHDEVDDDIEFVNLGLDSITGVEWIKVINENYGLTIQGTRVYDYPNIKKMADYLITELPEQRETEFSGSNSNISLQSILLQLKNKTINRKQAEHLFSELSELSVGT